MTRRPADVYFQLAKGWQLKGNSEIAITGFQRVLELDPEYSAAYVELGGLMLRQGRVREALAYYERAVALDRDNQVARFRYSYVKYLADNAALAARATEIPYATVAVPPRDNPQGKVDLRRQLRFKAHRGGWGMAMEALAPLHNSRGILFDGFLEQNFAWKHWMEGTRSPDILQRMKGDGTFDELATTEERGITPYTRPWVGFMHNPPAMPPWFHYQESPQAIFKKAIWQKSLASCVGLFALSEYHAAWLRQQTGKPVSVLMHPAETPHVPFDFTRFMANENKKIVQVGWWLRKLSAIYQLPLPRDNRLGYEKVRLIPHFFGNADHYLRQLMEKEMEVNGTAIDPARSSNTREMQHLPNDAYDELLATNIVFVDLYDASANNAVLECLTRATPLLVNPLPAVIEYLGEGYPLYFTSLPEAADKALDASLIRAAHEYLKTWPTRAKLSGDYFRRSFVESTVYSLI